MTEMERTLHAEPRASSSVCSRSRRARSFAESSDPGIVPKARHLQLPPPNPGSRILPAAIWGRMETTTLGDEPGFFLLLPGAGGIGGRMLSPLGHAAELMSSHCRRNEHRLALTGRELGATALSKELIFNDTFSPNKAVFGTADTSQPRTQQRAAGEGAASGKVGIGLLCPVFPYPPRCLCLFFKVLGFASHGQDGRGRRRPAFPAGRGVLSHPPPLIPGPPELLRAPQGPSPPLLDHS